MITCSRCHRPLTDPVSIRVGMGPECRMYDLTGSEDLCRREEFSDVYDNSIPFSEYLMLGRKPRENQVREDLPADAGMPITNIPHLVVHHSPDGFEYGYGGSGPSDLALNVCQLYLNMTGYEGQRTQCYDGYCWSLAYALHQDFKRAFLVSVRKTGDAIPFERIDEWFKSHITSEMLDQYSFQKEEQ